MFYIRKPTKDEPINIIRKATPAELFNYKNRFTIKPTTDELVQETAASTVGCGSGHKVDEMFFVK